MKGIIKDWPGLLSRGATLLFAAFMFITLLGAEVSAGPVPAKRCRRHVQ